MTLRARIGVVATAIFILGNLVGGIYAAAQGEMVHAGVHIGLMLIAGIPAWQFIRNRFAVPVPALDDELAGRLTQLEQSLDAIAIEVERIGQGQRGLMRHYTGNDDARVLERESRDAGRMRRR
jgi:hypothetical protein